MGFIMSDAEFAKVKSILTEAAVPFDVVEHAPVGSSEGAAQATGTPLSEWLKCMLVKFVRNGKDFFVMVNLPADKRLDLKKVKSVLQAQDAKLASKDDVLQQTGCEFGAVPPIGHPQKLAVLVDLGIFKPPMVRFAAGLKTASVAMRSADFRAALKKMGAAGFELTE
jgi:Ala-tRNA(Pro) deacylase